MALGETLFWLALGPDVVRTADAVGGACANSSYTRFFGRRLAAGGVEFVGPRANFRNRSGNAYGQRASKIESLVLLISKADSHWRSGPRPARSTKWIDQLHFIGNGSKSLTFSIGEFYLWYPSTDTTFDSRLFNDIDRDNLAQIFEAR